MPTYIIGEIGINHNGCLKNAEKLINAELIREHKRYYDKFEYEKLSKLSDTKIIKFYYFEFGLNTVCLMK